jgi:ATP-dependent phosphofructokinase / diphosphate-dependent phosphofructokinase
VVGRSPALLVAQSGGCTAAINASLVGVVEQALASEGVGPILGARFGAEGILQRQFCDLRSQDPALWPALRRTPSAALGSCRRKLSAEEREDVLDVLIDLDVRYFLYIGGNDSADTALGLHRAAQRRGYDLRVVAVPKTIDNDLPGTDHCPGFGSAARFLAQATQDAGLDTEAMRASDPIKIIEVMGRDAGWLAAATILGRQRESDAPHVICVPERPLEVDAFIGAIEAAYKRFGFAVAVVAETVRDAQNRPIGSRNEVQGTDAFGHPTIAGAAQTLTALAGRALGVKARFDKPGTIQRMCMALASTVDLDEAYAAGAQAVVYAIEGRSGCMVGFIRADDPAYRCSMQPVPLEAVANKHRTLPDAYLQAGPFSIDPSFAAYARPLIGPPLLPYARLRV